MSIGYVGLGSMGNLLAKRLRLQHELSVYDISPAAVERMAAQGATPCPSPSDLAAKCDAILLCLPTSVEVRAAIFGENGLAASAKPGTLIVDQTTGDPVATRAMAAELAGRGIALVDAPVSGGRRGAETGTIAIMVGAAPDQYARIEPILKCISPNVFHAGGVGAGHVMKLVNNMLSGAQRLLSFEGMALAVKNGIDPKTAANIINAGSGRNYYMERFMASHILEGKLNSGFTLGLVHKDVRLATQLGVDSGVPLFLGNVTREFYQMCINEMGKDSQVNSAGLVVDRMAGTHVIPPEYSLT
jgi:3-hydroxyisobutyrate dehydrogenase